METLYRLIKTIIIIGEPMAWKEFFLFDLIAGIFKKH